MWSFEELQGSNKTITFTGRKCALNKGPAVMGFKNARKKLNCTFEVVVMITFPVHLLGIANEINYCMY